MPRRFVSAVLSSSLVAAGLVAISAPPVAAAPTCTKGIETPANSRITATAVDIGGTEYCIEHIFTGGASQVWTVPGGVTTVDVYVIGAGAAGSRYGGGGGGGEVKGQSGFAAGSALTATVTVGAAQAQEPNPSRAESSSITLNGTTITAQGGYGGGLSGGGAAGASGNFHSGGQSEGGTTGTRPATQWESKLAGGGGGGTSTSGGGGRGGNGVFGSLDKGGNGGKGLNLSTWLGGSYTPDPTNSTLIEFGCGGGGGIYNDGGQWNTTAAGEAGCNNYGRGYRAIDGTQQGGSHGYGSSIATTGGFGRGGGGGFCSNSGCTGGSTHLGYTGDNGGVLIRWEAAVNQSITVGTDPFNGLGSIPYSKTTYTFAATADSGLAVTYSSADDSVCTVGSSSGVVTLAGAGTCTIQMDQAGGVVGDTTYAPAPQVTSTVTVTGVSIIAVNPNAVAVNSRAYDGTPSATLDTSSITFSGVLSGDTVNLTSADWTYASADAGTGIAVSGGSYSLGGANADGYALDDSNLPTSLTGDITPKSVTVTADNETFTYGGAAFSQSFTTSLLVNPDEVASVTYSYEGTGSTSYGPSATQPTEAGTYSVTPSAGVISPGNSANYDLSYVAGTVTGSQASQTVTLVDSGTTVAKTFGDGPVQVQASSSLGAGYPIEFSSSDESVCTVSGGDTPIGGSYFGTVAFTGAAGGTGTCVVTATQDGDRNYASDSDSRTFTVTQASQGALTITSPSPSVAVFGSDVTLRGTGGDGSGAYSWSKVSGPCEVSDAGDGTGTLSPTGVSALDGPCKVTFAKAADANYLAATPLTQDVSIAKRDQVVAFTSPVPVEPKSFQTYTARFASSLGSSYVPTVSVAVGSAAYCQVIDDSTPGEAVVYFSAAGPCTLEATQVGDSNTNSGSATQTIVVDSINQNITFNPIADQVFGVAPFSLGASTSSGRQVTYTSSTTGVCTVDSDGLLTIRDKGVCTVTVSRAADAQYAAANSVQHSFTVAAALAGAPHVWSVSPGDTTITTAFSAPTFTGAPSESIAGYEITATPTSGPAITQPCAASPLVCTMTGLANGTDYLISVAAVNSSGVGPSGSAEAVLRPATAANAVTGAYAVPDINGTSVHLYWDQLPNTVATLGGGSFTSYDVYVREVGGSWPGTPEFTTSTITTTDHDFTGLTTGQSYEFKIVAITTANSTALTGNTTIVTEYPSTVPGAVTELTLTETSDTSAVITWEVPITDGGAEITSYDVTVSGLRNCSIDPATEANRCVFTGMELGRTYTFTVTATNRMGEGPASRVSMTTPSPPSPSPNYDGPAITNQDVPDVVLFGEASWMVTENGRPVLTSMRPNRAKTGWVITGAGFDTEVIPLNAAKQPVGLGTSDNLQVPQGGWIEVRGDDYRPDTLVKAFLIPQTPQGRVSTRSTAGTLYLGSFDANKRGRINGEVYVPLYASAGKWVLQLVGQEDVSTLRSTNLALTIIDTTPGTETFLTQRAGFFKGQKAVLSARGKKKLRALLRGIPEGASIETIAITGVSVNKSTTRANLKLASQRADTIAEYLDKRGMTGTIEVNIYTQITIGTPRTSATAPQPLQTKQGKPLTTTSITYEIATAQN